MIELQIRRTCSECTGTGNDRACVPCAGTGKVAHWVPAIMATSILGHAPSEEDGEELIDAVIFGAISPERFHAFNADRPSAHREMLVPAPVVKPVLSSEHVQVAVQTWPLQTQLDAFALLKKMHTPLRVLEYQDDKEEYPAFLMKELGREKLETLTLRELCQTGTAALTQTHHLSSAALRQLHHLAAGVFLSFNA